MKLFILPFDHRSSFQKITSGDISDLKKIIFSAFLDFYKNYEKKEELAILVDEEYGKEIIKEAKEKNIKFAIPVEKSGKELFESQYENLEELKKINPDYVKVLVRYNPDNLEINKKQINNLKQVNTFCIENNFKLLFELLVPPTKENLEQSQNYDTGLRFEKTIQAIHEIQKEINVNIWKLEGFNKDEWEKLINIIDNKAHIIFLGRGESTEKVKFWLEQAKNFEKIIGFAIGRTIFLNPLKKYLSGDLKKEESQDLIKNNFNQFINLWNE